MIDSDAPSATTCDYNKSRSRLSPDFSSGTYSNSPVGPKDALVNCRDVESTSVGRAVPDYRDSVTRVNCYEEKTIMKISKSYLYKVEKQLRQWGAKLDERIGKANKAGDDVKADYRRHVDELKTKNVVAQSKFDELKAGRCEKWRNFTIGVARVRKELETAFKDLTN